MTVNKCVPLFHYLCILSTIFILLGSAAGCAAVRPDPRPFQCTDSLGCVDIDPGEQIRLGGLQTLSGGSSPAGIEQERSIRLSIELRGGQILGHPIDLQFEDEHCSSEGGANAALRLVADPQIVAIFGTNCSSAATTAAKIMSEKGLVMISSANTSPSLTSIAGKRGENQYPGYFRTSWNDTQMGRAAAAFAFKNLGIAQAAVINAGDLYTKGLTTEFTKDFQGLGGSVVLDAAIDEDEKNQNPILDAVALSGAKLVFFPLSHPQSGSLIVRQARQRPDLENLIFIGGEGMLSDVFIKETGPAGLGVYILGPAAPTSRDNEELRAQYIAKYHEEPPSFYYSFAYDAVTMLYNAILKTAIQDEYGAIHIGRQALRDTLYNDIEFNGLTGRINCDEFGDCGSVKLNIVRLDSTITTAETLRKNVIDTYSSKP